MTPITYVHYHCTKCGHIHESEVPLYSCPVKCPSCGEKSIRHGYPVLPTNRVERDEKPHRYHLGSTKETVQVYLRSLDGLQTGVCLDEDDVPDCDDDPVHVAGQVLSKMEGGLYYGGLPKLREVVDSMKANASKSEGNSRMNRVHELRKSLVHDLHELKLLTSTAED